MDDQTAHLPPQFGDLSQFVGEWGALATQDERYLLRQSLPMERLRAYYDVVTPRLGAIFDHLDGFAFDAPLPAPEALLERLVMGMSEVAQAVEVYGEPGVPHAPDHHSVPIVTLRRC